MRQKENLNQEMGVHCYDAVTGRWAQQDPVGGSLGSTNTGNRYAYADDDPVMLVDPGGRDAGSCFSAVVLGIIEVIGVLSTLAWFDPIAITAITALATIPFFGDALGVIGAVALLALNVWAVELTVWAVANNIRHAC